MCSNSKLAIAKDKPDATDLPDQLIKLPEEEFCNLVLAGFNNISYSKMDRLTISNITEAGLLQLSIFNDTAVTMTGHLVSAGSVRVSSLKL